MNAESKWKPANIAAGKSADASHLIIQRRYDLVRQFADLTGKVLLDFGCGTGAQTRLFARHFPVTVGVDISEGALRKAAIHSDELHSSMLFTCYDGDHLPLRDNSIDTTISFEVLEHVNDEHMALSELNRVMRPGATLAISVPNRWWVFETHGAALPLLPWNRVPFFSWLPKRIHDRYARARIYRSSEFVDLLEKHGFDVLAKTYITAPMDVVKSPAVQRFLRRSIFRHSHTRVPFLATAVLAIATRR